LPCSVTWHRHHSPGGIHILGHLAQEGLLCLGACW
jgi:hypothetical protein